MLIQKNIPNIITVSRIALSMIFVLLILISSNYNVNTYLTLCFAAIVISDIMDGYLARKMRITSDLGAKLDVAADCFYVIGATGAFIFLNILPSWFLVVLIISFTLFLLTSKVIRNSIVFDALGKTAAIMAMLLPGLFIFRDLITDISHIMYIASIIISGLFGLSAIYRVMIITNQWLRRQWRG